MLAGLSKGKTIRPIIMCVRKPFFHSSGCLVPSSHTIGPSTMYPCTELLGETMPILSPSPVFSAICSQRPMRKSTGLPTTCIKRYSSTNLYHPVAGDFPTTFLAFVFSKANSEQLYVWFCLCRIPLIGLGSQNEGESAKEPGNQTLWKGRPILLTSFRREHLSSNWNQLRIQRLSKHE